MSLAFTKEEVEKELADRLKHGRRIDVARISGLGESYIDRQFNPNDEKRSCAFTLLQIACALDQIDETEGDEFWRAVCRFRELSKKRRAAGASLNSEIGKLSVEVAEFNDARLRGLPVERQTKELLDVVDQAGRVKDGLTAEFQSDLAN